MTKKEFREKLLEKYQFGSLRHLVLKYIEQPEVYRYGFERMSFVSNFNTPTLRSHLLNSRHIGVIPKLYYDKIKNVYLVNAARMIFIEYLKTLKLSLEDESN